MTAALVACGAPAERPAAVPGTAASGTAAVADCGTFTLDQGEEMPDAAARCLVDAAAAHRPARLHVTSPTVEGDPIPTTYVARADGRVDLITDTRLDKFGARGITLSTCAAPTLADRGIEVGDCSDPTPVRDGG